jgi:serine/threonine protein phosphatase PrpC
MEEICEEDRMRQELKISACCLTDQGMVRPQNEDVCFVDDNLRFFLVADGMGGTGGGDVASALFLETAKENFPEKQISSQDILEQIISQSFSQANAKIQEVAAANEALSKMGCTAELLAFTADTFVLGHVGDSRTYSFQDGSLHQLTKDHSLVQQQVDEGSIDEEQAKNSKFKSVLTRAVGTAPELEVDQIVGSVLPGTTFLLCSDGVYNMLSEDDIVPVLQFEAPLEFKAEMLVNMANDAGGRDNISVTLVQVD